MSTLVVSTAGWRVAAATALVSTALMGSACERSSESQSVTSEAPEVRPEVTSEKPSGTGASGHVGELQLRVALVDASQREVAVFTEADVVRTEPLDDSNARSCEVRLILTAEAAERMLKATSDVPPGSLSIVTRWRGVELSPRSSIQAPLNSLALVWEDPARTSGPQSDRVCDEVVEYIAGR